MKKEEFDEIEGYCRRLGHYLKFKYCREENQGQPCKKILDCWFERIKVQDYIKEHYSEQEIEEITKQSPPKIVSLIEMIEKAKKIKK